MCFGHETCFVIPVIGFTVWDGSCRRESQAEPFTDVRLSFVVRYMQCIVIGPVLELVHE